MRFQIAAVGLVMVQLMGFAQHAHCQFAANSTASAAAVSQNPTPKAPVVDPSKFHALLIGCTKYDNLKPNRSLQGPANDVELMQKFFTGPLQLDRKSIAALSEPEAAAHGPAFRPTRENIVREIQKLISSSRPGDQVVLLLAGHGGQQPERQNPDPTYLKPDGLDQMFLPCDCGQWNGKKWCVEQAIPDFELRNWCKQITAKKARLWVILDCCCSGWTLRGDATEVARNVTADDLGIPETAIATAQTAAAARPQPAHEGQQARGGPDETQTVVPAGFDFGPQSPDYVGLYAAQRDESELEMPMPNVESENGQQRVQGLLTYAIVDILSRAAPRITYAELANLVRQRYPQWGRTTGPTPVVEGLGQTAEVLGVQRWPGRARQQWKKVDGNEGSINAGQVQGITPGSIVALYPAIDHSHAETLLGYARVTEPALMEATIRLCSFHNVKEVKKTALPGGGRFEVVWTDYGSLRTKLGIDLRSVQAADLANDLMSDLAAEVKQACAQEDSLCDFVENVKDARWVVQLRDHRLVLLSQDAAQIRGKLPEEAVAFPIAEQESSAQIMRDMNRIAQAQNLMNLTAAQQVVVTSESQSLTPQDDFLRPNVELKTLRFQSRNDVNPTEVDFTKGPLELKPGDFIGWRMTNLGNVDVAVSLLYIDAGFGIKAIFPRAGAGADNMLTRKVGRFTTKPARVTASPAGGEHVVLIAVPRKPQQQSPDFSCLEQETLTRARGAGEENATLDSPLGKLLQNAMFGHGGMRGLDTADTAESQLLMQSWRVLPESSP